ncbi:Hsp20 family protein [Pectobacteriaceae bacterium CE90]|nr:Hsp20 family protein [Prodigiosinella sp. LS101]WJV55396.1 Hsp20 family protein [Prodigiosinella sp. LS101]WJV59758.1 Hsp20 family protein [Pectobacteriaceae bacterium C111]WJY13551.1 Hsp20 family protein [Pectobacteriaceae bacterium CE90]
MAFKSVSLFPAFADSLFSDRFDRIDRLFSQLTGDTPLSVTPSYDIRRLDDTHYDITLSVPGWRDEDLEVSINNGQLLISGKHKEETSTKEKDGWLHCGISRSDFSVRYSLPDHVKVEGAHLDSGLLTVNLLQEIKEDEKPKKIAIEKHHESVS